MKYLPVPSVHAMVAVTCGAEVPLRYRQTGESVIEVGDKRSWKCVGSTGRRSGGSPESCWRHMIHRVHHRCGMVGAGPTRDGRRERGWPRGGLAGDGGR